MNGYYTPAEISEMFPDKPGYAESTVRARANTGAFVHAVKRGNTWFIPLCDISGVGRGHDKEFAEPQKLSPDYPDDPNDIVLAQNDDGRYGVYLEDAWYGAGQALVMLEYLRRHEQWLVEKTAMNAATQERGS